MRAGCHCEGLAGCGWCESDHLGPVPDHVIGGIGAGSILEGDLGGIVSLTGWDSGRCGGFFIAAAASN